jgi:E3 ubiquitin-protein ligase TRIP12
MRDSSNRPRKSGKKNAISSALNQSPAGTKKTSRDKAKASKNRNTKNTKVSVENVKSEELKPRNQNVVPGKSLSNSSKKERGKRQQTDKEAGLGVSRAKKKERIVDSAIQMSDKTTRKETRDDVANSEQTLGEERKEADATAGGSGHDRAHTDMHHSMESILRSLVQQGHRGSVGASQVFFGQPFRSGSSSHQREKIDSLLAMIENKNNPGDQLTGLSELCEHVSIASEDSMVSFPTGRVVPLLLEELRESENPDVMLLAARVLTLLLDVYPLSARTVSQKGGIGVLCEKLLSIEYIDLAEQSIQALGKMSESYPNLLLDTSQGNVLEAVLSFVDFFQIGMQRIAVATAANVCRASASDVRCRVSSLRSGSSGDEDCGALERLRTMFRGSIPALLQLTTSSDNKIALSAYDALTAISKSCSGAGVAVESVIDVDSMQVIIERLVMADSPGVFIKPCVFYAMMRFVSTYTLSSVELPGMLLDHRVPYVVASILALLSSKAQATSVSVSGSIISLQELKPRNQEEMFVLLSLVDNIFPPVLASDLEVFDRPKTKRVIKTLENEGIIARDADGASGRKNLESIREKLLDTSRSAATDAMAPMLLDALLHLEFATLSRDSKLSVLSVVDKIVFYSSPTCLTKLVTELPVSVFIIRLLQSSNHVWPLSSLKFVASLLQKQPELRKNLLREGILHEVKKTKESFLTLGQSEKDLSAAFAWFADRVLRHCFGENPKETTSDGQGDMEGVFTLRKLRERMAGSPGGDRGAEQALPAMEEFFRLILERSVSPYEIHASGILEDVYRYLKGDGKAATRSARRTSFLSLFESLEATERVIDMLQEIVMNNEHLQVINSVAHAVPTFQSMMFSNLGLAGRGVSGQEDDRESDPFVKGLEALGTPLRIKLHCIDEVLHDRLGSTAILIEPLATVTQTQSYLKPKIGSMLTPGVIRKLKAGTSSLAEEVVVTRSKSKHLGYLPGMGNRLEVSKPQQGVGLTDHTNNASTRSSDDDSCDDDMEEELLEELMDSDEEDVDMIGGGDINASENGSGAETGSGVRSGTNTRATKARQRGDFSIKLFLDGRELDASDTLLGVLHSNKINTSPASSVVDLAHLWKATHHIDFRVSFDESESGSGSHQKDATTQSCSVSMDCDSSLKDILCLGKDFSTSEDPADRQVYYAVRVLQVFEDVLSLNLRSLLVNSKICSKLTKQMKDPLLICSRTLPDWCSKLPYLAKFLFSYEARRMYFRYHSFGLGRTLLAMLEDASWHGTLGGNQDPTSNFPFRMPRIVRHKVRISRSHVFESSKKVFERYADAKSRLEVEFYNEAGSGLGPTLEFYTLLSTEFQRRDLGMWRESDIPVPDNSSGCANGDSVEVKDIVVCLPGPKPGELPATEKTKQLVTCPFGLFPKPVPGGSADSNLKNNFKLLGLAAAKAIQDNRLLDVPLSRSFYKVALHGPGSLDRDALREIDPPLFKTLSEIRQAVLDAQKSSSTVMIKGVPIDDLFLSFVLPGDDDFELSLGGRDVPVTSQNAAEYVDRVFDAILNSGIRDQMAAFREGFDQIFSLDHLAIFYEDEIETILCGDSNESWTPESLAAAIKCDHGYTSSSPPVIALINVLSTLDPIDKRRFLKFVTGAPRLPAGGFASLKPKLTVVRKSPDIPVDALASANNGTKGADKEPLSPRTKDQLVAMYADRDLPSVMTCANYLKLPPYSSTEALRDRLLFSIREGQNSFDLS